MASEKEILKALSRLMDSFTIYNKDPEAIKAFTRIVCEKLSQFPALIINRAVEKIIETYTFMPKIAEMLSACYAERDKEMNKIYNRVMEYKADWRDGKLHSQAEWEALRSEYLKLNALASANSVMDDYLHYSKLPIPMPEETKKKIDDVLAKLEVK